MTDRLPPLTEDYPLSPDQEERYREQGHIKLAQVASAQEVAAYRPFFQQEVMRRTRGVKKLEDRDTYGKAFLQVGGTRHQSPECLRFVLSRRFAHIAARLMGVPAVRLYNDQALYKEPGGGFTPWHQDQVYWPLDTPHTITMWMPLVPVPETVGSMRFVTGSHRLREITDLTISSVSAEFFDRWIQDQGYEVATYGSLNAGDATFHAGWTVHSAPGNPTDHMREVITVIYFADGSTIMSPDNREREVDLRELFPGQRPGDVAGTHLNPVVWSRDMSHENNI